MKNNIKKHIIDIAKKIYFIILKVIIIFICILFFINLKIFIMHIIRDGKALAQMYEVNDFLINRYNLIIGELEEYGETGMIPFAINKILRWKVHLRSGKTQDIFYGVQGYSYPNKFKYLKDNTSLYYVPYSTKEKAQEIMAQIKPQEYRRGEERFLVNTGIFFDSNQHVGAWEGYREILFDTQEYFLKEYDEDGYFRYLSEALTNCRRFRYAPEELTHIDVLLKKDEYDGGFKIYYMSKPIGIEGYFVEADIKTNQNGEFHVEDIKAFKYEKDWFNNAQYSIERARTKRMSGWLTGDSRIKEMMVPEESKVGEIQMDDGIVYYWQGEYREDILK